MSNKYISVGKILNFHGVRGEAKVGYSKNQQEFMTKLCDVFILKDNNYIPFEVTNVKFNNKFAIIKFKGIDTVNDIVEYKNCLIFVEETTVRENLEEDEFLIDELVGMKVFSDDKQVGVVVGVSNNGVNDLLSVKSNTQKVCLVPFVKAIVLNVDIKKKEVIIENIQGLIE
ncbi:MAG: ribosome maturation factor RimM [Candidatus Gastranaerophilales bacterium]|nr:ribosome maturation factor RimM [Candidatus Gastranaerophilales bacterium]